jgi:hypothetical protein
VSACEIPSVSLLRYIDATMTLPLGADQLSDLPMSNHPCSVGHIYQVLSKYRHGYFPDGSEPLSISYQKTATHTQRTLDLEHLSNSPYSWMPD